MCLSDCGSSWLSTRNEMFECGVILWNIDVIVFEDREKMYPPVAKPAIIPGVVVLDTILCYELYEDSIDCSAFSPPKKAA